MYLSFVCEWVNRWTSVRGMPGNLIQWMNLRFSIYSLDILCGVAFFIEISYYASSHTRFILHGVKSMFHTGHSLAPKCCHLFQCILKWCRQFATAIVVSNSKYIFFYCLARPFHTYIPNPSIHRSFTHEFSFCRILDTDSLAHPHSYMQF